MGAREPFAEAASSEPGAALRLSRSPVWDEQRAYFEAAGNVAWRANAVPSYVTVNPFIAATYVEMVRAFAAAQDSAVKPITVIELGAGSGRFAYHFLDQYFLDEAGDRTHVPPIRYIMTDVSAANIAFWRNHERFQPYLADGRLDMVMFDAGIDLTLDQDLRQRLAQTPNAPLVVIANYVFDSLPQDLFRITEGRLQEALVSCHQTGTDTIVEGFNKLYLDYCWRDCALPFYDDPCLNTILQCYAEILSEGSFLMPTSAFECIARLRSLNGDGPFLALLCDRGFTTVEDHFESEAPQPALHGSFSFPVNFHALSLWAQDAGGIALLPGHRPASIAVAALGFNLTEMQTVALDHIYRREVQRFGPDDFFLLKQMVDDLADAMSLRQLLALLRLSGWDRAIFLRAYDRLVELLPEAEKREREAVAVGLKILWRRHLDLGEDHDLGFQVGSLLAGLGHPREAIAPLEFSIKHHGADETARANLEICRAAIG